MHRAVAKKKILAQEMVPQKNSGRLKIPHPPHHFSNGPSLSANIFPVSQLTGSAPCSLAWLPGYCTIFAFERRGSIQESFAPSSRCFFSSFTDGMVRNDLKQNTGKTQVIVIRDVFSHTCGSKRSDCTNVESM